MRELIRREQEKEWAGLEAEFERSSGPNAGQEADAPRASRQSADYQEHCNDVCRVLGQPTPSEADPKRSDFYCFQKRGGQQSEKWRQKYEGGILLPGSITEGNQGNEGQGKERTAIDRPQRAQRTQRSLGFLAVKDLELLELHEMPNAADPQS